MNSYAEICYMTYFGEFAIIVIYGRHDLYSKGYIKCLLGDPERTELNRTESWLSGFTQKNLTLYLTFIYSRGILRASIVWANQSAFWSEIHTGISKIDYDRIKEEGTHLDSLHNHIVCVAWVNWFCSYDIKLGKVSHSIDY